MNTIQLFAQLQGGTSYSDYQEIDLYEAEPIKISKSVQSLEDPKANTSNFSRSFRVPNTSPNGQYFKAVFNVNSVDYNATQKAPAYINVDGAYFISGNIRLENVYRNDKKGKVEYEIIFMGETSDFASVVGPKLLRDLSLGEYNHYLNLQSIQNSWTNNLYNGDIIYPLAEWGYTYDNNGQPEQNTVSRYTGAAGGLKGFTNAGNPLSVNQFKPFLKAKMIWDKIFEEAGYTYESQFLGPQGNLTNNLFGKLYFCATNDASPVQVPSVAFEATSTAGDYPSTYMTLNQNNDLLFPTESYDYANAWDVNTSKYTIPYTGAPYQFVLELECLALPLSGSSGIVPVEISAWKTTSAGVTSQIYTVVASVDLNQGGGGIWGAGGTQLDPKVYFSINGTEGDKIFFRIRPGNPPIQKFQITSGIITVEGPLVVTPTNLLSPQYYQLDFLKGINDKFKLVWEPDPDNPKNFFIEPWKNWVAQGSQKDWSDKLDENQDIKIEPLFRKYAREIIYKDGKDSDLYNFSYEQEYKQIFGQLNTDSGLEVITGKQEIDSFFAPTPVAPIGNYNDFLVPHFAKDTEFQRQPIEVKPRLVFYNGMVDAPLNWYLEGATNNPQTEYPLVSNFDSFPFNAQSFDLNWNNVPQYWDSLVTGYSGNTANTAFTQYWKSWWDNIYNPYSRVMEATFKLSFDDIAKLRFNDLIYVKDSWWTPIEIKDYALSGEQNVKVILQKLGAIGVNINPTAGDPGAGTKFYLQSGLCFGATSCVACCCNNKGTYAIYTDGSSITTSAVAYADIGGTQPAAPGWYSDGTSSILVLSNGFIQSVGTCAACSCAPTGLTFGKACASDVFCDTCCCASHLLDVYFDGATLDTSLNAYGTTGGASLLAGKWYKTSGGSPVLIGNDGHTILSVGNCSVCNCSPLEYQTVGYVGISATGGCCPGTTGSGGISTVFHDDPVWLSSTEFYLDAYKQLPITGYTSDGDKEFQVTGGTGSYYNVCKGQDCPDRQIVVSVESQNTSGTAGELTINYEISYDGVNWLANESDLSSGSAWFDLFSPLYASQTYARMYLDTGIYGGDVSYVVYRDGDLIHIDGGTAAPFTTIEVGPIIAPVTYEFRFAWTP